jgi:hypothetical protein
MKFQNYLTESEDVWKYFHKETDMPMYDEMIDNPDYYRNKKNRDSKIVIMTPEEYWDECAKIHKKTPESQSAICDKDTVDRIIKSIKETGSKMYLPSLDYATSNQEGRHRAMISKQLGLKKIPVLVVNKVDKEKY